MNNFFVPRKSTKGGCALPRLATRPPPRACCMEQSWNNGADKSLCFPAFARKHCSIDFRFSFARGPALPKKVEYKKYFAIPVGYNKRPGRAPASSGRGLFAARGTRGQSRAGRAALPAQFNRTFISETGHDRRRFDTLVNMSANRK